MPLQKEELDTSPTGEVISTKNRGKLQQLQKKTNVLVSVQPLFEHSLKCYQDVVITMYNPDPSYTHTRTAGSQSFDIDQAASICLSNVLVVSTSQVTQIPWVFTPG
jgi:hypothetical protein